jgi:hypothetical protein
VEESVVVAEKARTEDVTEWGRERYVSKTHKNFLLWRKVFGVDVNGCETNGA